METELFETRLSYIGHSKPALQYKIDWVFLVLFLKGTHNQKGVGVDLEGVRGRGGKDKYNQDTLYACMFEILKNYYYIFKRNSCMRPSQNKTNKTAT